MVLYLNYLQLDAVISLWPNKTSADDFNNSVNHSLARRRAIYSIA